MEERLDGLHRKRLDGEAEEVPVLDQVVERCLPAGGPHRDDGEDAARLHERRDEGTGQLVQLVAVVDEQDQPLTSGPPAQRRRGSVEDRAPVEVVCAGGGGDVDRQQVRQRRERDRSSFGVTARSGARHAGSIGELEDLVGEAGLADTGAAGEEHPTGRAATEALREHLELAGAPDHRPCRAVRRFDERGRCLGR